MYFEAATHEGLRQLAKRLCEDRNEPTIAQSLERLGQFMRDEVRKRPNHPDAVHVRAHDAAYRLNKHTVDVYGKHDWPKEHEERLSEVELALHENSEHNHRLTELQKRVERLESTRGQAPHLDVQNARAYDTVYSQERWPREHEDRLDYLEARAEHDDERLWELERPNSETQQSLYALQKQLDEHAGHLGEHDKYLGEHDKHIDWLGRTKLGTDLGKPYSERLQALERQVGLLEDKFDQRLQKLESQSANHERTLALKASEIEAKHKYNSLRTLEQKVSELERAFASKRGVG